MKKQLIDKYMPDSLAGVYGHGAIIADLQQFCAAPSTVGMLFHGDTGLGKSITARAVAMELGVDTHCVGGGWLKIEAGEQTRENVEWCMRQCRMVPMLGSPWHVVVVEEADHQSAATREMWLGLLNPIPAYTVVIFTTNNPLKLEERLRRRFTMQFHFTADRQLNLQDAQALADSIWRAETGSAEGCPRVDQMKDIITAGGEISYRSVVASLERPLRDVGPSLVLSAPAPPARDLFGNRIGTAKPAPRKAAASEYRFDPVKRCLVRA
jgi:hypothetical protein